jgi:alcohol dehydrogenase, propanol-preferring
VHGALVTAVSNSAFQQAIGMLRRRGTLSLVGLPPGTFPTPIFEVVLKRLTIRGSIVGTRLDLSEALDFAANGLVASRFSWEKLENINAVFDRMRAGSIEGRVVLDLS